jgi:hypothetical protein
MLVLGSQQLLRLRSGRRLAGPAVAIPVEAVHVVLAAAARPIDHLRLELGAEVAAVLGVDAALVQCAQRPRHASLRDRADEADVERNGGHREQRPDPGQMGNPPSP